MMAKITCLHGKPLDRSNGQIDCLLISIYK